MYDPLAGTLNHLLPSTAACEEGVGLPHALETCSYEIRGHSVGCVTGVHGLGLAGHDKKRFLCTVTCPSMPINPLLSLLQHLQLSARTVYGKPSVSKSAPRVCLLTLIPVLSVSGGRTVFRRRLPET